MRMEENVFYEYLESIKKILNDAKQKTNIFKIISS